MTGLHFGTPTTAMHVMNRQRVAGSGYFNMEQGWNVSNENNHHLGEVSLFTPWFRDPTGCDRHR